MFLANINEQYQNREAKATGQNFLESFGGFPLGNEQWLGLIPIKPIAGWIKQ